MQDIHIRVKGLRGSQFLKAAPDNLVNKLALEIKAINITTGHTVFTKGDIGNSMYFLVEGRVKVHNDGVVLARLNDGEVFGEIGALASENRTATVTAETDCLLYCLEQDQFYDKLGEEPHAARSIIQALCEREIVIIDDKTRAAIKNHLFEKEMEIGRRIQSGFLPDSIPQHENWQLAGNLLPAREVAGDFYDFYEIKEINRTAVVIGDVCDKGVGAALFMTLFRSLLRANAMSSATISDSKSDLVAEILKKSISHTNDYIAKTHGASSMFTSVFFGLLDPSTGEMDYINAGHESPMLIKKDGNVDRLDPTGPVIGLFSGIKHSVERIKIEPGMQFLAFTDGVPEAKNPEEFQYGEERLLDLLSGGYTNAQSLITHIYQDVNKFSAGADQYDDMTMVAVMRRDNHADHVQ